MLGKEKCRILKEIRKKIAEENDINYIVEECDYKGHCIGVCPRCEADVEYLSKELSKKKKLAVAITGLISIPIITSIAASDKNTVSEDDIMGLLPMNEFVQQNDSLNDTNNV